MPKVLKNEDIHKLLEGTDFELVGDFKGSNNLTEFKSKKCGHKFKMVLRNLKRKIEKKTSYCPDCEVVHRNQKQKKCFNEVKKFVSKETQREYKVVSKEKDYDNNKSLLDVYCKTCGSTFKINLSNFQAGRRCPICANKTKESKTAQLLKRLLEQVKIEYREEEKFSDCTNPFTDGKLRFDIYIPALNLAIEIDGEQHYIPITRFGGEKGLQDCQWRDHVKNKFCYENGIELIRVSLFDLVESKKKSYEFMKLEVFTLVLELVKRVKSLQ